MSDSAVRKAPPRVQRLQLQAVGGASGNEVWESDRRLRIGRMESYEVTLDHYSISRQHAELVFTEQGWMLRDLGSRNGTFLNGVPIGRVEKKVRHQDIIQVGHICLQVILGASSLDLKLEGDPDLEITAAVSNSWSDLPSLANAGNPDKLMAFLRVGRSPYEGASFESYLEALLWETAEVVEATRGVMWVREEAGGFLNARAYFGICGAEGVDWDLCSTAEQASVRNTSLLARRRAPTHSLQGASFASHTASAICAVLRTADRQVGILQLIRDVSMVPFTESELALADGLALVVSGGVSST